MVVFFTAVGCSHVPVSNSKDNGFLEGDGFGNKRHVDLVSIGDAVPRAEVLSKTGNKPYVVFGKSYRPMQHAADYRAIGHASWYGAKFHGRKTSSGEPYDMYAMTAAHRELPLPSYVRVTNLANQRSVVVKVNDRGPFIDPHKRLIDLSYVAAAKLGMIATGTAEVQLEVLTPASRTISVPVVSSGAPGQGVGTAVVVTAVTVSEPLVISETAGAVAPEAVNRPLTPPAIPVAKAMEPPDEGGSIIKIGAFSNPHNSSAVISRLRAAGLEASVTVVDGLYRVQSGPYSSVEQALAHKLEIDRITGVQSHVISR